MLKWVCMIKRFILFLINIYQKISALTPARCRFYPTCSEYMKQAIMRFGVFRGGILGIKRIVKCHPLNEGGYDPVPDEIWEVNNTFFSPERNV